MADASVKSRIKKALNKAKPTEALIQLAKTLKAEGMSQQTIFEIFTESQRKLERDSDALKYAAVLEMLDIIGGWCVPSLRLFDTVLPI